MSTRRHKEELRDELRRKRKSIDEEMFERWSSEIRDKLMNQPEFAGAKTIHCYVSMNSRREVDTHPLIKKMFSMGKKVAVPVTNFEDGSLTHMLLNSFDDLQENKWGVLEPERGNVIGTETLDLVIVPMVGADKKGNRIGYGKGFYDRFLQQVNCPKIGLIFEQNIVDSLPVEPFDIPMDKIISEERIIHG